MNAGGLDGKKEQRISGEREGSNAKDFIPFYLELWLPSNFTFFVSSLTRSTDVCVRFTFLQINCLLQLWFSSC
ncbi:hypothetical protein ANANG_G00019750 [Anguilla anguilla]|uniref:Uncharacterized protein n=1 Tax=Anguilla anguilla TaxID=7936 RepID=A0A0E9XA98_ANGAN|nr:hypothetical protein ANANG_G00019750 [Anguilla anguilla]